MSIEHIVVDGSNIATEGRSLPSLAQLEGAVAELRKEHPNAEVTVIVDATFAHRIDQSELARFEEAALRGEYAHPPAGAIGRGDAFLLRVAEKVDGTVLSNDSFQEFHGEHEWLFDRGRLLGGTPLAGIGWIFSPRQPVRGPRSRQAVRETVQAKKRVSKALAVATKEVVAPPERATAARRRRATGAIETGQQGKAQPPGQSSRPRPLAVNDPLPFVTFIAEHRLGDELDGEVESYTSHGAVIRVGEMQCYVPLANLGDPPPRSARDLLKRGDKRTFVLTALDPQRRGAELSLPGVGAVTGHPRQETVEGEVRLSQKAAKSPKASAGPPKAPAQRARPAIGATKAAPPARKSAAAPEKQAAVRGLSARARKESAQTSAPESQSAGASPAAKKAAPAADSRMAAATPSPRRAPSAKKKAAAAGRSEPVARKAPAAPAARRVRAPGVARTAPAAPAVKPAEAGHAARKAPAAPGRKAAAGTSAPTARRASRPLAARAAMPKRSAPAVSAPVVPEPQEPSVARARRSPRSR